MILSKIQYLFIDWEARMDNHGRIFYIDHKNHKTTWQKPAIEFSSDVKKGNKNEGESQSADQSVLSSANR